MTNKQTIDGVSRELLEWLSRMVEPVSFSIDPRVKELRALLDKPELMCKGAMSLGTGCGECSRCMDELRMAAQPQGEVERLRYKAELYDEVWELATGLGYMNVTTAIGTLRAKLAERDALLRDLDDAWNSHDGRGRFGILMRKVESLSTSAEPKPRGEAVAIDENREFAKWMHETVEFTHHGDKVSKIQRRDIVELSEEKWAFDAWLGRAKLSAGQPSHSGDANEMVAKVVLPFTEKVIRKLQRFQECTDDGQGADIGRHWLDLLTQLGLLNRVQRSPALWEITQQGDDALEVAKLNGIKP